MAEILKKSGIYTLIRQDGYYRLFIKDTMQIEWKANRENFVKAFKCFNDTINSGEVKDNQKND